MSRPKTFVIPCFAALFLAASPLAGCEKSTGEDGEKSAEGAAAAWVAYESPEANYEVAFPSEPKRMAQMIPTDAGEAELISLSVSKGAETMMVSHTDMGAASTEGMLQILVDNMATESTQVLRNETVDVGGHPGWVHESELMDGKLIQEFRAVVVGQIAYQLLTLRRPDTSAEDYQKFLDSFVLVAE